LRFEVTVHNVERVDIGQGLGQLGDHGRDFRLVEAAAAAVAQVRQCAERAVLLKLPSAAVVAEAEIEQPDDVLPGRFARLLLGAFGLDHPGQGVGVQARIG
jgi:hypothetical protein